MEKPDIQAAIERIRKESEPKEITKLETPEHIEAYYSPEGLKIEDAKDIEPVCIYLLSGLVSSINASSVRPREYSHPLLTKEVEKRNEELDIRYRQLPVTRRMGRLLRNMLSESDVDIRFYPFKKHSLDIPESDKPKYDRAKWFVVFSLTSYTTEHTYSLPYAGAVAETKKHKTYTTVFDDGTIKSCQGHGYPKNPDSWVVKSSVAHKLAEYGVDWVEPDFELNE